MKKNFKKYFYVGSAFIAIAVIAILFSKTNIDQYDKNSNTVPLIPSPSTKTENDSPLTDSIPPAKNLTPSELGSYSIENNVLVYKDQRGITKKIDTGSEKVVNFHLKNKTILITTGSIYGSSKSYYLYLIDSDKTIPLQIQKISPIVSVSQNSDGSKVGVLGNYDSSKDTANLYLYDTKNNTITLTSSGLHKNSILFIDDKNIAISSIKHQKEPNVTFDIYDSSKNETLIKNVATGEHAMCVTNKNLYFLNYTTKSIDIFNIEKKSIQNSQSGAISPESFLLCGENNLVSLVATDQNIETNFYTGQLATKTESKNLKNVNDQIFIQAYIENNKLFFKYLDKKTDQLYLKEIQSTPEL